MAGTPRSPAGGRLSRGQQRYKPAGTLLGPQKKERSCTRHERPFCSDRFRSPKRYGSVVDVVVGGGSVVVVGATVVVVGATVVVVVGGTVVVVEASGVQVSTQTPPSVGQQVSCAQI